DGRCAARRCDIRCGGRTWRGDPAPARPGGGTFAATVTPRRLAGRGGTPGREASRHVAGTQGVWFCVALPGRTRRRPTASRSSRLSAGGLLGIRAATRAHAVGG